MTRGPVPAHSSELSRPRDANRTDRPDLKKGVRQEVTIPAADPEWDHVATQLWEALQTSGQSDFYQDSDWAYAYMLMDDITQYRRGKRSGQMAATIYSAMTALLITEADRRRARIELDAPEGDTAPASVAVMDDYRQGLMNV